MLIVVLICIAISVATFVLLFVLEIAPGRQPSSSRSGSPSCRTPAGTRPRSCSGAGGRRGPSGSRRVARRPSARRCRSAAATPRRVRLRLIRAGYPERRRGADVPGLAGRLPAASALLFGVAVLLPLLGHSAAATTWSCRSTSASMGYVLPSVMVGRQRQAAAEGNAEGAAGCARHAGGQRRGGPGPEPGPGPGVRGDRPDQPGAERAAGAGEPGDPGRHRARGGAPQPGDAHRARRHQLAGRPC